MSVLHVARVMADIYLAQRFVIAWRVWLTDRLTGRLAGWPSLLERGNFVDATIDNPDQRIQQDVDIFTAGVGGSPNAPANGTGSILLFGAVNSVVTTVSYNRDFVASVGDLNGLGHQHAQGHVLDCHRLCAAGDDCRVLDWTSADWLSFRNEKLNAAFRYALVRLRDAAEAVSFYRGERAERGECGGVSIRSSTTTDDLFAAPSGLPAGTFR